MHANSHTRHLAYHLIAHFASNKGFYLFSSFIERPTKASDDGLPNIGSGRLDAKRTDSLVECQCTAIIIDVLLHPQVSSAGGRNCCFCEGVGGNFHPSLTLPLRSLQVWLSLLCSLLWSGCAVVDARLSHRSSLPLSLMRLSIRSIILDISICTIGISRLANSNCTISRYKNMRLQKSIRQQQPSPAERQQCR